MKLRLLSLALLGALSTAAAASTAAPIAVVNAEQRAAFGIETATVETGSTALSKPYPAKVAVPNAQLRVISAPLDGVVEARHAGRSVGRTPGITG